MKRVLFPKEERAIFFPSVPESINPLLLANSIAKELPKVVIMIDASITQSEKLGEDACALLEFIQPKQKIDFLLFDEIPESNHPEAFERHCDRISALSQLAAKEKNLHRRINSGHCQYSRCNPFALPAAQPTKGNRDNT